MTDDADPGSPQRLRVLHIVLSLGAGGTERLVIEMCRTLAKRTVLHVCCLDEPGAWSGQITDLGIPLIALHRKAGFHPRLAIDIARYARSNRIGVIHCHHYSPFVYGRMAAWLCPGVRNIIYTEHGRLSDAPPSRKRKLANLLLGRTRGSFVGVSESLKAHMVSMGFPEHRLGVVYNGIHPGSRPSQEARRAARERLAIAPDCYVFGTVARLDPVKDLATMIEAFDRTERRVRQTLLVVIGDGDEREKLAHQTRSKGLDGAVRLLGARDDARDLMPAFDAYLNSSITEGVSVTILEAMAAGIPVIATRVGGTPEVVVDGQTGLLVPARDPDALARAMGQVKGDPAGGVGFGQAARERLEARFSMERMVAEYGRLYAA